MTDWARVTEQLRSRVGAAHVHSGSNGLPESELRVAARCAPGDTAELAEVMRVAAADKTAIYPVGGGTLMHLGLPGEREGIAVETTRLDRVIDYPSRDMTVTVQAGIRITSLQKILSGEGQRLPVDVPRGGEATLGGAIATNTSGPRRYALGTFRDYVIGISVVDADGNETKAGGRVVKNVAGYDLCKLYTGSLGALGIITQVTLKLRPLAQARAVVRMGLDSPVRAAEALDRLAASRTRPTAIELLNRAAADCLDEPLRSVAGSAAATCWTLVILFEENLDAVGWQRDQLRQELKDFGDLECLADDAGDALCRRLTEFQAGAADSVMFKANFLPSATVSLLERAERQPVAWAVQAHAGSGIAYGRTPAGAGPHAVAASLAELRAAAVAARGNLVLRRCPSAWKKTLPVWGEPRGDAWLMRELKAKLDPHGILNPGRLLSR